MRADACAALGFAGVSVDPQLNEALEGEGEIGTFKDRALMEGDPFCLARCADLRDRATGRTEQPPYTGPAAGADSALDEQAPADICTEVDLATFSRP